MDRNFAMHLAGRVQVQRNLGSRKFSGLRGGILALLMMCHAAWAQDFDAGIRYYENKEYKKALQEFQPLANQNHAPAQDFLGYMYEFGQGVAQNYAEALKWYRKAADQGHINAQGRIITITWSKNKAR